jgi:hypothetical protein
MLAMIAAGSTVVRKDLWRTISAVPCQPHRRLSTRTTHNYRQTSHDPLPQCTTDTAFRPKFGVQYPKMREISTTIQHASHPQAQHQLLKNQLRTLTPEPNLGLVQQSTRMMSITMMKKNTFRQRGIPKAVPE